MAEAEIRSVADTALWMAGIRANETARPDAIFDDRFAAVLAGERGRQIAAAFPGAAAVAWGVVIRTAAIDRLIKAALQSGVDTVVNLGAGMDARPYRMHLPAGIRWIEMDLPEIVESKNALLRNHAAACSVERIGIDLADRASYRESLCRSGAASRTALVIAEGVIPYLSNGDALNLARELRVIPSCQQWILDFDNAGARGLPPRWARKLRAVEFPFKVHNWFEFFQRAGWQPRQVITTAEESERNNRPYPFVFPQSLILRALPREVKRRILGASGAVLMTPCEFDPDG